MLHYPGKTVTPNAVSLGAELPEVDHAPPEKLTLLVFSDTPCPFP